MEKEYKYEILDAVMEMEKVEEILFAINIPNPDYQFMRWADYPYRTKMPRHKDESDTDYYTRTVRYRILPYLYDYKVIDGGYSDYDQRYF